MTKPLFEEKLVASDAEITRRAYALFHRMGEDAHESKNGISERGTNRLTENLGNGARIKPRYKGAE
jgi:hypothetical protein